MERSATSSESLGIAACASSLLQFTLAGCSSCVYSVLAQVRGGVVPDSLGKSIAGGRSCSAVHSKKRKEQPAGKINWVQTAGVVVAVAVAVARVRHDPSHWKIEGAGGVGASTGLTAQCRRAGLSRWRADRTADRLKGQVTVLLQAASCLGGDGQLGRIGERGARMSCKLHSPGARGALQVLCVCRVVTGVSRWRNRWRPLSGGQEERLVNCNGVRAQQCPVGPVASRLLVLVLDLLVLVPNLES